MTKSRFKAISLSLQKRRLQIGISAFLCFSILFPLSVKAEIFSNAKLTANSEKKETVHDQKSDSTFYSLEKKSQEKNGEPEQKKDAARAEQTAQDLGFPEAADLVSSELFSELPLDFAKAGFFSALTPSSETSGILGLGAKTRSLKTGGAFQKAAGYSAVLGLKMNPLPQTFFSGRVEKNPAAAGSAAGLLGLQKPAAPEVTAIKNPQFLKSKEKPVIQKPSVPAPTRAEEIVRLEENYRQEQKIKESKVSPFESLFKPSSDNGAERTSYYAPLPPVKDRRKDVDPPAPPPRLENPSILVSEAESAVQAPADLSAISGGQTHETASAAPPPRHDGSSIFSNEPPVLFGEAVVTQGPFQIADSETEGNFLWLTPEDWNGDQTLDLIGLKKSESKEGLEIALALSKPDGTYETEHLISMAPHLHLSNKSPLLLPAGDFNKDGVMDYVAGNPMGPIFLAESKTVEGGTHYAVAQTVVLESEEPKKDGEKGNGSMVPEPPQTEATPNRRVLTESESPEAPGKQRPQAPDAVSGREDFGNPLFGDLNDDGLLDFVYADPNAQAGLHRVFVSDAEKGNYKIEETPEIGLRDLLQKFPHYSLDIISAGGHAEVVALLQNRQEKLLVRFPGPHFKRRLEVPFDADFFSLEEKLTLLPSFFFPRDWDQDKDKESELYVAPSGSGRRDMAVYSMNSAGSVRRIAALPYLVRELREIGDLNEDGEKDFAGLFAASPAQGFISNFDGGAVALYWSKARLPGFDLSRPDHFLELPPDYRFQDRLDFETAHLLVRPNAEGRNDLVVSIRDKTQGTWLNFLYRRLKERKPLVFGKSSSGLDDSDSAWLASHR